MRSIYLFILGLLLMFVTDVSAAQRLSVYTVNYPLAYFAERIGGDYVEVVFPHLLMSTRHTGCPTKQPSRLTRRPT